MDLKIRQSYHGTGGSDGYRFKVYNSAGKKLGELVDLPVNLSTGDTLSLNGLLYIVTCEYDSRLTREERSEVLYYELDLFEFKPSYNLFFVD